ncbi:hypothetical protein [Cycloclasticus pugetii]|uniref:hypothetical protein n=1 Tax=Cycloclasticus pugetii TaxID=34068 RepID=UPI00240A8E8C|nr:hypothetical protein [Cycloclasticus pugetii]MDF1830606.1 hypothetical protein [Cycloclasticus pugetii]
MNKMQLSAQDLLEQLEGLKNEGVDLTRPLLVYIPGNDNGDFIENGVYELYSPSHLKVDINNSPSLVVEPIVLSNGR